MSTILFNEEFFGSVAFSDYHKTWSNFPYNELDGEEKALINQFVSQLPEPCNDVQLDTDKFLLIKADDGVFDRCYGPVVHQHPDEPKKLVLKVGDTLYPITESGTEFTCGDLMGSPEYTGEELSLEVEGKKHPVQNMAIEWVCSTDNGAVMYRTGVRLQPTTSPSKANLALSMRQKKGIAQYCSVPSSGGGGSALNMIELEIGKDYLITASKLVEGGQYGDSYIVTIDGQDYWAKGLLKKVLSSGKKIGKDFDSVRVTSVKSGARGDIINMKLWDSKRFAAPGSTKEVESEVESEVEANLNDIPF